MENVCLDMHEPESGQSITTAPAKKSPKRHHRETLKDMIKNHELSEAAAGRFERRRRTSRFKLPTTKQSAQFCRRCRQIDFKAIFQIFSPSIRSRGIRVFRLGFLGPTHRKSKCALCRLFASAAFGPIGTTGFELDRDRSSPSVWHLFALHSLRLYGLKRTANRVKQSTSIVLSVNCGRGLARLLTQNPRHRFAERGNFIVPIDPETQCDLMALPFGYGYEGRIISPLAINYQVIQLWLDECRSHHPHCDAAEISGAGPAKIIDCKTRAVIPTAFGMQYFTLSYVWGPAPTLQKMGPADNGGCVLLPRRLPATVQDAIKVVLALGERYLWVDRYCIDQDPNSTTRRAELLRMDQIFENGITCLVATGPNASSGLFGVSNSPRYEQPVARVGGSTLALTLPSIHVCLQDSEWLRRAWTYQEAQLAKRCIIFTQMQVYVVCRDDTQAEAVRKGYLDKTSLRDYQMAWKRAESLPSRLFMNPPTDSGLGVFYKLLMDYWESVDHLTEEAVLGMAEVPIAQSQSRKSMNSKFIWRTSFEPQPLLQLRLLEYSQRSLTYGSDALDAFRGLLSRSKNFSYHGIPIFAQISEREHRDGPRASLGISFGLAWARFFPLGTKPGALLDSPSATDARRQCFPSWSWTSIHGVTAFALAHESWSGKETCRECLHFDADLYSCYPRVKVEDKNGRVCVVEIMVAAYIESWKCNKSTGNTLELGTKAGQIDPRIPELSNFLWLHGYRAKCFVVFHGPDYMDCIDKEALQSLVVAPGETNHLEAFEQGRSQVNIYWDNPPHDFNNAEPTSQWNLVLLLRKRSKMQNYETGWWLLVNSTTGDDGTLNARRVGLVRTWSRPRKGFPIEDAVVRLA